MPLSEFPAFSDDFALPAEHHTVFPDMPVVGRLPDPTIRIPVIEWKGEVYGAPSDNYAVAHPTIQMMIDQM